MLDMIKTLVRCGRRVDDDRSCAIDARPSRRERRKVDSVVDDRHHKAPLDQTLVRDEPANGDHAPAPVEMSTAKIDLDRVMLRKLGGNPRVDVVLRRVAPVPVRDRHDVPAVLEAEAPESIDDEDIVLVDSPCRKKPRVKTSRRVPLRKTRERRDWIIRPREMTNIPAVSF